MQADSFVNVSFDDQKDDFYQQWMNFNSAKTSNGLLVSADKIRNLHPNHAVVSSTDSYRLNVLSYPGVTYEPRKDTPLLTEVGFQPLPTNAAPVPGMLFESVLFGSFDVEWREHKFILYLLTIPMGMFSLTQTLLLNEDSEEPARDLLLTIGLWSEALHNEIWVFNQGFWSKDAALWRDIQSANWDDVILDADFKKALKKDVYGFFSSEKLYKNLGIPWKRGLIMHGPPGNGKTISLKAIMKSCDALGFKPLYIKSFTGYGGEEASMASVFNKARQVAPCVVILEDLDALINDRNRSFFLNQMDGLQGNDGLLVIGTTNHFDRLDPGLSTRPSRFDRKFLFDDPSRPERVLYAVYWQNKLKNNEEIEYPDTLVDEIAGATDRFSFAYLKEAYVSSLVLLAGIESEEKPSFKSVILDQITILRKQLDKSTSTSSAPTSTLWNSFPSPSGNEVQSLLARLSAIVAPPPARESFPSPSRANAVNDFQSLLGRLSESVAPTPESEGKRYFIPGALHMPSPSPSARNPTQPHERSELREALNQLSGEGQFRALFDRLSVDSNGEDFTEQLRDALNLRGSTDGQIRL